MYIFNFLFGIILTILIATCIISIIIISYVLKIPFDSQYKEEEERR